MTKLAYEALGFGQSTKYKLGKGVLVPWEVIGVSVYIYIKNAHEYKYVSKYAFIEHNSGDA